MEEIAGLLGVHKNTVRAWIDDGLPICDSKRPQLIRGSALRNFLHAKRASKKRPCRPGELYCLRCRQPRMPAGEMADFQFITVKVGNLLALCPVCEAVMNQRIGLKKLATIRTILSVKITQAPEHIGDRDDPCVNSDFNTGEKT